MSSKLLGRKGAIYSLPQKLGVTACAGRRLRCKWAGDSGQAPGLLDHRGRPEIPVQRAGDSGQAGDSGHSPGMLRAPIQYHTTKMQRAEKKLEAGDSGSFGPETPVDRRLRTISGVPPDPSQVAHHSKSFGSEKRGTGDSGSFGPETPV